MSFYRTQSTCLHYRQQILQLKVNNGALHPIPRFGKSVAGSAVQLDAYSDTLQPFFEVGGHSGQLWSFSSVAKVNDVAFSTVGGVATASTTGSVVQTAVASLGPGVSIDAPPKASKTASSVGFTPTFQN